MPPKHKAGGCNCCEVDPPHPQLCTILDDDFDRPDSTDIGSDWSEVDGDWEISNETLTVPSTNALVTPTTSNSGANNVVHVHVQGNDGDIARVYATYNGVSDVYAEVEFGTECGFLRLFKGGVQQHVDQILLGAKPGNWVAVSACHRTGYSGRTDRIFAQAESHGTEPAAFAKIEIDAAGVTGKDAALATGGTAVNVSFDAFTWNSYTDDALYCESCETCLWYLLHPRYSGAVSGNCEWNVTDGAPQWVSNPTTGIELPVGTCEVFQKTENLSDGRPHQVEIKVWGLSLNSDFYLLLDYEDPDNYHYARITAGTPYFGIPRVWLYLGSAGDGDLISVQVVWGSSFTLTACVNELGISARYDHPGLGNARAEIGTPTTPVGGNKIGFSADVEEGAAPVVTGMKASVALTAASWADATTTTDEEVGCTHCPQECLPCWPGTSNLENVTIEIDLLANKNCTCTPFNGSWVCDRQNAINNVLRPCTYISSTQIETCNGNLRGKVTVFMGNDGDIDVPSGVEGRVYIKMEIRDSFFSETALWEIDPWSNATFWNCQNIVDEVATLISMPSGFTACDWSSVTCKLSA